MQEVLRIPIEEPIIRLEVLLTEVLEVVLILLVLFHEVSNVPHVVTLQELNQTPKSLITVQKRQLLRYHDLEDLEQELYPLLLPSRLAAVLLHYAALLIHELANASRSNHTDVLDCLTPSTRHLPILECH